MQIADITKKYGNKTILDNISLIIPSGCSLMLGENGSGKTTFLKILAGLIKKYDGSIDIHDNCSISLDNDVLYSYKTGYENLELFLDENELINSNKLINDFSMNDYIYKKVRTYSNGMKKKLSLVIALSKNKDYLLLDEPTNSLDKKTIITLKNILKSLKKEKTILIASHDITIYDDKLTDNILMLNNKKINIINGSLFNYKYYKIKTINEAPIKYEKIIDDYKVYKVFNDKLEEFTKEIGQYGIIEINPIEYYDSIYMEELYDKVN